MRTKLYKKLLIRTALKLFFAGASLKFINLLASAFFSRAKKPTKMLVFTDRLLNKKICECKRLHDKCEYFKDKLNDSKYAPV